MEQDDRQLAVAAYEDAGYARLELEATPFWAFGERRRWRQKLDEAQARIDAAAPAAANQVLLRAFAEIRGRESHRNAYHPEVRPRLGELAQRTVDAAHARPAPTAYSAFTDGEPWTAYPRVAELLNPVYAQQLIAGIVDKLEPVAEDPVFLYRPYITNEGANGFRIQHKASGLRADFTLTKTGAPNIGAVFSKPYRLRSIDPDNHPGEVQDDWQNYVGLGIGKRLYQAGAQLMPQMRWRSSAASPYAAGARAGLHQADPWRWQFSGCPWCREHELDWTKATPEDFAGHPRRPLGGKIQLVPVDG